MHPILSVAVGIFLLFLVFYVLHGIFLVYHLLRFSIHPSSGRALAAAYVVISVFLLVIVLVVVSRAPWDAPLAPRGVSL